jgi:hypothetical protein
MGKILVDNSDPDNPMVLVDNSDPENPNRVLYGPNTFALVFDSVTAGAARCDYAGTYRPHFQDGQYWSAYQFRDAYHGVGGCGDIGADFVGLTACSADDYFYLLENVAVCCNGTPGHTQTFHVACKCQQGDELCNCNDGSCFCNDSVLGTVTCDLCSQPIYFGASGAWVTITLSNLQDDDLVAKAIERLPDYYGTYGNFYTGCPPPKVIETIIPCANTQIWSGTNIQYQACYGEAFRHLYRVPGPAYPENFASVQQFKYKFKFESRSAPWTYNWIERFTPDGGGSPVDTPMSEEIPAGAEETSVHEVTVPDDFGSTIVSWSPPLP